METKARGLGSFEGPSGRHYVLDLDIPEYYSRFEAGHPQLGIVVRNYRAFEDVEELIFPLATLLAILGMIFVVTPLYAWIKRRRDYRSISFTIPGRSQTT